MIVTVTSGHVERNMQRAVLILYQMSLQLYQRHRIVDQVVQSALMESYIFKFVRFLLIRR